MTAAPRCRRCGAELAGSYSSHVVAAAEQYAAVAPDGQGQGHAVLAATSACSWNCLAVLAAQLAGPDADAAVQIVAERERQVTAEGAAPEHDDHHDQGVLAQAGALYALQHAAYSDRPWEADPEHGYPAPRLWPFDAEWWKPKGRVRDLVRAGALIAAELDRDVRAQRRARAGERF